MRSLRYGRKFIHRPAKPFLPESGVDPDFDADHADLVALANQIDRQGYISAPLLSDLAE